MRSASSTGDHRRKARWTGIAAAVLAALAATSAPAANDDDISLDFHFPDWKTVPIADHDLGGGVHMLESFGGNMGVIASRDGIFVVDAEYPEMTERLRAIIARISSRPVRFVVNTHYHWDHAGGDGNWARGGATIVSSTETRAHIVALQTAGSNGSGPYVPDPAGVPTLTTGGQMTFHVGDETVEVTHLPPTHTDGDLLIRYVKADVIQTGDAFFKGFYPDIDIDHGGSIDGMIAMCDRLYAMAGPATKIIPGHGGMATRDDARVYGDMLRTVRDRVARGIAEGKTMKQLIAAHPLADLDPQFGGNLVKAPYLISIVYQDLSRNKPAAPTPSPVNN